MEQALGIRVAPVVESRFEDFVPLYSLAMATYDMVDRTAEEVIQHVTGDNEHRIACRRGCNACCTVYIRATFAEAAAIALWLFKPSNTDRLIHYHKRMAGWRKETGAELDMLEALSTRHGIHLESGSDSQLFAEAIQTYHRRKLMCPFNADDGSCEIYPFRPVVCRAFFVVGASERCGLDVFGEVGVVRQTRLTETALLGQKALKEASATLGYGSISALPVGVHRAVSILEPLRAGVHYPRGG